MEGIASQFSEKDSKMIDVKLHGAVGDGAADDTQAVQRALNLALSSRTSLFFPSGDYRLREKLHISGAPLSISGEGKSLTRLRWETPDGGLQFAGQGVAASDITCFEVRSLSITTDQPNGGVALRFEWPTMFANPQKKVRVHDVEIRGTDAYAHSPFNNYWTRGIWITNPGGLDLSHVDILGSQAGADIGILCNSESGSGPIRHFLSNIYVLQHDTGIKWVGPNEGVYFNNFEVVGCRLGFSSNGGTVYSLSGGHFDCYESCLNFSQVNELKLSSLALFHTSNGGARRSGNLISLSDLERFIISCCSLFGHPGTGDIQHQNGILLAKCRGGVVIGNTINHVQDAGILFDPQTQFCYSTGNFIQNCGTTVVDQGSNNNHHAIEV